MQQLLEASMSWGCLHVYCPRKDARKRVRNLVTEIYARAGLERIEWEEPQDLDDVLDDPFILDLALNKRATLGDDEVLIQDEYVPNWVAVMSHRWEWAPPARHPLALAISYTYPVLSVTCIEGQYAEYSRYESGSAVQLSLVGPAIPADAAQVLPALDLDWFRDKGAAGTAAMLREAMIDPQRFTALVGPDCMGLRDSFEAAPLEDYPAEDFLVLRHGV